MKAYLFDVDGVLSDPVEKQVTELELFDQIISRLQKGYPICLNTGRSTQWMFERFITPFIKQIDNKSILLRFIAIGEKGGTWITFDETGAMHHGKINTITIPKEVIEKAKQLVNQKYHDSMFFDETKETMMSIEMQDGFDISMFTQRQKILVEDLKQLLEEYNLQHVYNIDPTTICTDVESPKVGKALGADLFLDFLKDNAIVISEFKTFGDSLSDFAMSDELERKGKSVKMIYVGDRKKLGKIHRSYQINYIPGFSQGTLHYLQKEKVF